MGLSVAGVDLLRSRRGPLVLEVNSSPGLEGIEGATLKGRGLDHHRVRRAAPQAQRAEEAQPREGRERGAAPRRRAQRQRLGHSAARDGRPPAAGSAGGLHYDDLRLYDSPKPLRPERTP
jgi:ribosomal protein S6--L-glutamate ligase